MTNFDTSGSSQDAPLLQAQLESQDASAQAITSLALFNSSYDGLEPRAKVGNQSGSSAESNTLVLTSAYGDPGFEITAGDLKLPGFKNPIEKRELSPQQKLQRNEAGLREIERLSAKYFKQIDSDHDGYITPEEVNKAISNPETPREAAPLLHILREQANNLSPLSKEWLIYSPDKGVSAWDLESLHRLSEENKDWIGYSVERIKSHSAGATDTLYGNDGKGGNPLESIRPEAVEQGNVGDCFFMSATLSLASKNPQAIKDMIRENNDGTYTVTFPGAPDRPITIDKPTPAETAIYGASTEHGIWPAVLEKAFGEYRHRYEYQRSFTYLNRADGSIARPELPQDFAGGLGADNSMGIEAVTGKPVSEVELGSGGCPDTIRRIAQGHEPATLVNGRHEYGVIGYDKASDSLLIKDPNYRDRLIKIPVKDLHQYFAAIRTTGSGQPQSGCLTPTPGEFVH
ncbi:MAG: C2 family cysteine protease [Candidatus Obscuribacterales bacterium]